MLSDSSQSPPQLPPQQNVCRICRTSDERPLKAPCLCTGSIKFVHSDCLLQWIQYSKSEKCHICKTFYRINNTFQPISSHSVLRFIIRSLVLSINYIMVGIIWFLVFPCLVNVVYETYHMSGSGFNAFWAVPSFETFVYLYMYGLLQLIFSVGFGISFMMLRESVVDYLDLHRIRLMNAMANNDNPNPPAVDVPAVEEVEQLPDIPINEIEEVAEDVDQLPEEDNHENELVDAFEEEREVEADVQEEHLEQDENLHNLNEILRQNLEDLNNLARHVDRLENQFEQQQEALDNDVAMFLGLDNQRNEQPLDENEQNEPDQLLNNAENEAGDGENEENNNEGLAEMFGLNGKPLKSAISASAMISALFVIIGIIVHFPRQIGAFMLQDEENDGFGNMWSLMAGYLMLFLTFIGFYIGYGQFQPAYKQEFGVLFLGSKLLLVFGIEILLFPYMIGWVLIRLF